MYRFRLVNLHIFENLWMAEDGRNCPLLTSFRVALKEHLIGQKNVKLI